MLKEQITLLIDPEAKKSTEYGFITNREWLILERDRMNADGNNLYFIGKDISTEKYAIYRRMTRGDYDKRVKSNK